MGAAVGAREEKAFQWHAIPDGVGLHRTPLRCGVNTCWALEEQTVAGGGLEPGSAHVHFDTRALSLLQEAYLG